MIRSTFEEQLAQNGRLIYTNKGSSMLPLIREGRDLLIIEPVHGRLKKYDVPLYKRDSGQYVLHRILKVRSDDYVICGDNHRQAYHRRPDRYSQERTHRIRKGQKIPAVRSSVVRLISVESVRDKGGK